MDPKLMSYLNKVKQTSTCGRKRLQVVSNVVEMGWNVCYTFKRNN